jgi:hypothetical protein
MRTLGTQIRGIRTPIIQPGDDLVEIVVNSLKRAWETEGIQLQDRDVVAITESVVARAQNNFATVDQIAQQIRTLTGGGHIGLVFPILSRNRFSILLKAIAKGAEHVTIQLSYPSDEVGNHLISWEALDDKGINPYLDVLTEAEYRRLFGEEVLHPFTGIDYVNYYKSLADQGNISIIFSNDPKTILSYSDVVIAADIHTRHRTKCLLAKSGAKIVLGLDDIMTKPVNGSGYNSKYGLLGSNKSTEDAVKLFPEHGQEVVDAIAKRLFELTNKKIEVMIYGDGAFKDPVGKIWELADPVVSPAHTPGLKGTPNEIKLKYLADTEFKNLKGEAAQKAMIEYIKSKGDNLVGCMASQGTTPRQITDLLGSLCDLTSGSGDKGTPVVLVQGYFDNYAS